jgi:hypothetical protein
MKKWEMGTVSLVIIGVWVAGYILSKVMGMG